MRWLLTSWGSRGDLHPFLALGMGLLARGHKVTLVGNPDWEAETRAAGLRFVSSGEASHSDIILRNPEILSTSWGGLTSLRAMIREAIAPGFDGLMAALLAEAPGHDVLVAHHFAFPAPAVAELTGIPWATVSLAPGVVPSAHTLPGPQLARAREGALARQLHRFIWTVGQGISQVAVDPEINRLRARHGLKPVRRALFDVHSPVLNLQLYSETFAQRPPDWSPEKRLTGFCFYDPPDQPALAPEVEAFLQAGEVPVLFTLGSVTVQTPGAFYQSAAEALKTLGLRGLLLIGSEANRPAALPDSILAHGAAPFGLLMPRVRAVAHQCGIGTLSHTLRAGVPSLACPFAFDQPNNARRLEGLGVAELLRRSEHTPRRIGRALERLLAGQAPAEARRLGEIIRAEDGVGQACGMLEEAFPRAKS